MANPACSNINPNGTYIDVRLGEEEYAQAAVMEGIKDATRPIAGDGSGTQRKWLERATRDLARMIPFGLDKMEAYVLSQGWFKQAADGSVDFGPALKRIDGELGYVNSILKVYMESRAQAVKQLADNFLMKVKNGEDAVQEGLLLSQQMQSVSKWGEKIVYMDKELGGGLQQSKFAWDNAGKMGRFDGTEALGKAVNPEQYEDIFKQIYSKLNGGDIAGGTADLIDLAEKIKVIRNPHEISKQVLGMKLAGNAWNEVWINGLLSAPITFTTNLFSAAYAVSRPMITYGAAKALGMAGNKLADQVAAESAAAVAEIFTAFNDALMLGMNAMVKESALYSESVSPAITSEAFNVFMKQANREVRVKGEMAEFVDLVGQITRLPGRGLLGTDEFAQHLAYRGQVAAYSVRNAARDGVDLTNKKALQDYLDAEMGRAFDLQNPDSVLRWKPNQKYNKETGLNDLSFMTGVEGSGRTIMQNTREATFQENNPIANGVNRVINIFPMLKPLVPFVRTPLNIIKAGFVESTLVKPLWETKGALTDAFTAPPTQRVLALQKKLLQDPEESFRIAGQIALTSAFGGVAWGMVMSGNMTGGGPGRWTVSEVDGVKNARALRRAQQAWLAAGNVPYSIRIPGTDTWVPLDRFGEPFSITLRMIADMAMYSGYIGRDEQDELFGAWTGIAASGMFNASFARGMYEFAGLLRGEDIDYLASKQAREFAATQLPFGSFLAYVDRLNNPYKSVYQDTSMRDIFAIHEDAFGRGIFGKLADKIPGVTVAPPLVDQLTGELVPIVPGTGPTGLNPLQQAIPLFPRNSKADSTWQTVMDILGSYQEKSAPFELTEKEQMQFNQEMSTVRINGVTISQAIRQFSNRADAKEFIEKKGNVLSGRRFQVQNDFNNLLNLYKEKALLQLGMANTDVLERAQLVDALNNYKKANDIDGAQQVSAQIDSLLQRARLGY